MGGPRRGSHARTPAYIARKSAGHPKSPDTGLFLLFPSASHLRPQRLSFFIRQVGTSCSVGSAVKASEAPAPPRTLSLLCPKIRTQQPAVPEASSASVSAIPRFCSRRILLQFLSHINGRISGNSGRPHQSRMSERVQGALHAGTAPLNCWSQMEERRRILQPARPHHSFAASPHPPARSHLQTTGPSSKGGGGGDRVPLWGRGEAPDSDRRAQPCLRSAALGSGGVGRWVGRRVLLPQRGALRTFDCAIATRAFPRARPRPGLRTCVDKPFPVTSGGTLLTFLKTFDDPCPSLSPIRSLLISPQASG